MFARKKQVGPIAHGKNDWNSSISGYVGYIVVYLPICVCHCKGHYGHRKSIQTNTIPVRWEEATIFDANQFRRTYPHWGQIIFLLHCVLLHIIHLDDLIEPKSMNIYTKRYCFCSSWNMVIYMELIPIFSHEISGSKRPAMTSHLSNRGLGPLRFCGAGPTSQRCNCREFHRPTWEAKPGIRYL